jgi:hypothetical protein
MAETVKGARLCGAVQFEVTLPTLGCCHCHCSICRRFCGAGCGTLFQVRRQQFRLLAGEGRLRRYRSSARAQRAFCDTCGSSLFGEPDDVPAIGIALASMLGPIDREPERHICWDDRAPWVRIGDDVPRLGGPEWTPDSRT